MNAIIKVKMSITISNGQDSESVLYEEFVVADINQSGLNARVEKLAFDKIVKTLWMREDYKIVSYKTLEMIQIA